MLHYVPFLNVLAEKMEKSNWLDGSQHLAWGSFFGPSHSARGGLHCANVKIAVRLPSTQFKTMLTYRNHFRRTDEGPRSLSIRKVTDSLPVIRDMMLNGWLIQSTLSTYSISSGVK